MLTKDAEETVLMALGDGYIEFGHTLYEIFTASASLKFVIK
jgi:hypothetical protein